MNGPFRELGTYAPQVKGVKALHIRGDGSREKETLKKMPHWCVSRDKVSLHSHLSNPNIVRVINQSQDSDHVPMALDWPKNNLDKHIKSSFDGLGNPRRGPEAHLKMVKGLLYQLLRGVAYLHSHNIIHLDLKPADFLISVDGQTLRFANFGVSGMFGHSRASAHLLREAASFYYQAPELLFGSHEKDPAIDIWSVGCIFAEMLSGRMLFRFFNYAALQLSEISAYLSYTSLTFLLNQSVLGSVPRQDKEYYKATFNNQEIALRWFLYEFPQATVPFAERFPFLCPEGYDLLEVHGLSNDCSSLAEIT